MPRVTLDPWGDKAREILKIGEIRGKLKSDKAARLAGVSRATYSRRKAQPGTMTLAELHALVRPMRLSDDELLQLVRR